MTFNLASCLRAKVASGKIPEDKVDEAVKLFEDFQRQGDSDATAAVRTEETVRQITSKRGFKRVNAINKQLEALARVDANPNRSDSQIANSFFEFDPSGRVAGGRMSNIGAEADRLQEQQRAKNVEQGAAEAPEVRDARVKRQREAMQFRADVEREREKLTRDRLGRKETRAEALSNTTSELRAVETRKRRLIARKKEVERRLDIAKSKTAASRQRAAISSLDEDINAAQETIGELQRGLSELRAEADKVSSPGVEIARDAERARQAVRQRRAESGEPFAEGQKFGRDAVELRAEELEQARTVADAVRAEITAARQARELLNGDKELDPLRNQLAEATETRQRVKDQLDQRRLGDFERGRDRLLGGRAEREPLVFEEADVFNAGARARLQDLAIPTEERTLAGLEAEFAQAEQTIADLQANIARTENERLIQDQRDAEQQVLKENNFTALDAKELAQRIREEAPETPTSQQNRGEVPSPSAVNIHREYEAVRNNAHALMSQAIEQFRTRAAGLTSPVNSPRGHVLEYNVLRELFGEKTGVAEAKQMAKGIQEAQEYLRAEFNRNGGDIQSRKDFALPQTHDANKVRAVGQDEWVAQIKPLLNRERMAELDPSLRSDERFDEALRESYNSIVSGGLNKVEEDLSGRPRSNMPVSRHNGRFLQFDGPDNWIAYQREFGQVAGQSGSVVFNVSKHIEQMSKDIAVMRALGPEPDATIQTVADRLKRRNVERGLAPGDGRLDQMRSLLVETTGAANAPVNEKLAGGGIVIRNLTRSALLGASFFSALTDVGFSQTAAKFAGLPQFKTLARHLALFSPSGGADRRQAVRLGLGAQGAIDQAMASARVSGEALGDPGTLAGSSRKVADVVMRAGLLQPWTEAGKWAFGTEFLGALTRLSDDGAKFADLPSGLQSTFQRHGIDELRWERIRDSERFVDPETGADFIRPIELIKAGLREEANALQRMISAETEFAIPSSLSTGKNTLRFGTHPGTVAGEIVRSATMLKSFPVTVAMLQAGRFAGIQGGLNKAKYGVNLAVTTGIMGVIAEQLSEIASGRDPRPMDGSEGTSELVLDGLFRAGTFGLLGDIAFSNFDRFGSSLGGSLAGPLVENIGRGLSTSAGTARDTVFDPDVRAALVNGNLNEFLEETDVGRDALRFAQGLTPGQNLWWGNLITQRLLFDNLQAAVDPEYARSFDRMEDRARNQGTEFFFRPQAEGVRAPDFGNAFDG